MIRLYAIILLLLIRFAPAKSQGLPGYIITLQGDSVTGSIREKKHQVLLLYPSAGGARQYFRASQVQGYGLLDRSAIRSRVVRLAAGADSTFFVLPIELGPVSLFSYVSETGLLLRPSASDTLQELTSANWQLLFNRYLRGCATLNPASNEVLDMRFTTDNVRLLLSRYNYCSSTTRKANRPSMASPWRYGLGLQAGAVSITLRSKDILTNKKSVEATGWAKQAGIEWTAIRASGLQVGLGVGYKQLAFHDASYQLEQNIPTPLEQQDYSQSEVLTIAISLGKRWGGHPARPSFYGGASLGSNFLLGEQGYSEQRLAGTTAPFQRVKGSEYSSSGDGAVLAHLDVQAGVLFPLGKRQEIRLTTAYQYYVFSRLHGVGAQLSYFWFWK